MDAADLPRNSRWVILGPGGRDSYGSRLVRVQCGCSEQTVRVVRETSLLSGHSKSCGCLQREAAVEVLSTHRLSGLPEYKVWQSMKGRCLNPNNPQYPDYGGRGIRVCSRWASKRGFANFYADIGPRPSPQHSVDRRNNDGPYAPSNCRWATMEEQQNNKRNCRRLTFQGRTQTLTQWSRETKLGVGTLRVRLRLGWPIVRVLMQPANRGLRIG